jgi:hypothetical protein
MSVMKRIITMLVTLSVTLSAMVMPVLAATEVREPPGELAVRIFLGFCALIIVAQLLPLARQTLRRMTEKKAKPVEARAEVREH